jgi:microcystin-dependent protein
MAYKVNYTETTNPAKPPINVEDQTLNTEKSVSFPGKNYAGYGAVIAENFLHLLENFAKNTAPPNPVQGQLWYDNTPGINLLKIYDGTTWTAAGAVKKAGSAPLTTNSIVGDLWVDTSNQQLYIWSGSNWLLVGPNFSEGLKTGPVVETITDTNNISHPVDVVYANNQRISVQSETAFTPKATLPGFPTITRGINLNTLPVIIDGRRVDTKFNGTATVADALNFNGQTVQATNFLRNDIESISNAPISIRSNSGVSVGTDLSFNIGTDSTSAILYSLRSGSSIDLKVNSAGNPTTVIHASAAARVGIGTNNTSPQETLDVAGSIVASGRLFSNSTTNATQAFSLGSNDVVLPGNGSIATVGGLSVAKDSWIGGSLNMLGQIKVNNLDNDNAPLAGPILIPQYTSDSNESVLQNLPLEQSALYDIGTETRRFRNVYADSFIGNFTGTVTTTSTINGSVSGSASRLASPTTFRIGDSLDPLVTRSDVISNTVAFDGQGDDPIIFTATITPDFITNKTSTLESIATDSFLIFRGGASGGLRQVSKQTIVNSIAVVPTGAIFPFAGRIPPTGYLLCDGSEVKRNDYLELFTLIQFSYRAASQLIGAGTFALPDLRGRFPLGADNMDNGLEVGSISDESIPVDAGGGSANRVTEVTADVIGAASGLESRSLSLNNVPDHKHNLNSGLAQYYVAGLPGAPADPNSVPNLGMPTTSIGSGLPNSGGVLSPITGEAFNTMNPYLTINYIIFTGKLQ